MTAQMTDAEVIVRARADPERFAEIFDRHFVTIHRYLARRVGPDVADDLAGEVFRIAFERRVSFDADRSNARPWLYGIATNLLHGRRRTEERKLRAVQRIAAAVVVPIGADVFDRASERVDAERAAHDVGAALRSIPAADRDALVLFAVEGLSYPEVAVALGIPVGTVRSRISRARRRIRELLEPDGQQQVGHRLSDRTEGEERRNG